MAFVGSQRPAERVRRAWQKRAFVNRSTEKTIELLQTEVRRMAALLASRPAPAGGDARTAAEVRAVLRSKALRTRFFDAGFLGEPFWAMLLDLYAAELGHVQVSVSSLCLASGVAPTTALRWISRMEAAGLLHRHADPFDKRRTYVVLTNRARDAMVGYMVAARQEGLSIG